MKIAEWCSVCGTEVEIPSKLDIHECPNCKASIIPCSLCYTDSSKCSQCELSRMCSDRNNLNFAVQYVVSQLNYVAVHSTYSDMCDKREPLYHVNPSMADTIVDLLEEYGEDNDLSECWWSLYGDIEEIFELIVFNAKDDDFSA